MSYGGTKTWSVGDAWPIGDANTYIRDNFDSVRNYQTASKSFFDRTLAVTTTYVTVASHLSLLDATPDEAYEMHVMVMIGMYHQVGGAVSYGLVDIFDESGAVDISPVPGHMDWEFPVPSQTFTRVPAFQIGFKSYSAGSNAGFIVKMRTAIHTMDVEVYSQVFFRPLV